MVATLVLLFLLGLIAGGVVNALADDLPQRRRPRLPHYPDDSLRPVSAWLGLLAFVFGRRTSVGGSALSWRYPLVELGTGVLFALTFVQTVDRPEMNALQLAFFLVYMALFMLITVIDLEHRLILFVVMIPSYVIALLDAALTPIRPDLGNAVLGGVLGFGIFFLFYVGGFAFTWLIGKLEGRPINEVAFGYGDVMLIALSGLILGPGPLLLTIFITVFLGAAGAILYLVVRRLRGKHTAMFTPLPYGQYIVIATVIMLLFSQQMRSALL